MRFQQEDVLKGFTNINSQLLTSEGFNLNKEFIMSIWDKSTKVLKAEFANPDFMDPVLLDSLIQVREHLNRPMTFTQSVSGTVYHPNGDAVGLFSDSHSTFSLHQYHCNHSRSHEIRSTVKGEQFLGKAQDWDCKDQTSLELFETYLNIERLNLFSGIGLYPDWHRHIHKTENHSVVPYLVKALVSF